MSNKCNFMAPNVLSATVHSKAKISTRRKVNVMISKVPFINSLGKSFIVLLTSKNIKNDSQENRRVWPESKIRNFNPEALNLNEGELVQIRSKDEIFATLDKNGKYKGLLFMQEMLKFCGEKRRVFKTVKKIQLETTLEMRELKSPTVFLEGVFCDGEFHDKCDRSCFLYWKEAWLKRATL